MQTLRHMRKILIIAALTAAAAIAAQGAPQVSTLTRADRAFAGGEWASAAALYELVLSQQPDTADVYARTIIASEMAGDTLAASGLVERAMSHGIGFTSLLGSVKQIGYSIGQGDSYGALLNRLRTQMPWMGRPLDNELLRYYTFRNDGPNMVKYARIMLQGLPESREYLSLLARGYVCDDRLAEAAEVWRQIVNLYPDDFEALVALANYYAAAGDRTEALKYFTAAREVKSTPYIEEQIKALID